jgi:hypothetical protein
MGLEMSIERKGLRQENKHRGYIIGLGKMGEN